MSEQQPPKQEAPVREHIMQFFAYAHLPPTMQAVSSLFGELAEKLHAEVPRNPERTVALRKLLEAKDAAVRALIAKEYEWDSFACKWTQKGGTGPAISTVPVGA